MSSLLARTGHTAVLLGHVLRELAVDSAALVIALVNPRHRFRPRMVEIPLRCRTDRGVAMLGLLVTLSSPRQVSVAIQTGPPRLLVYMLDAEDAETARADLFQLETLLLRAAGSPARDEDPPEEPD